MAVYVGENKAVAYHGDSHPLNVYQGKRKITGYNTPTLTGKGRVVFESPYNAALPSVVVKGEGRQEKLEGKNLWTTDKKYPIRILNYDYLTQVYTIKSTTGRSVSESLYTLPAPIPKGTRVRTSIFFLSGRYRGTISFNGYHRVDGEKNSWQPVDLTLPRNKNLAGTVTVAEGVTSESLTDLWAFIYGTGLNVEEDISFKMMLEVGTGTDTWEPYCGGIPAPNPGYPIEPRFLEGASITDGANTAPLPILRALPDGSVRDEIDLRTGTVTRRIRELVLDGTEAWVQTGAISEHYQGYALKSSDYNALLDSVEGFCNTLIYEPRENVPNSFSQNKSTFGLRVVISKDIVPNGTNEEWKAYLAKRFAEGNPIAMTYALATPIIEHYDPAILRQHPGYTQLIQQGGFTEAEIEATVYQEDK